jgi:flagellar biosynthesis/type III secretory pathway chaperone
MQTAAAISLAPELEAARALRACLQQERECLISADIAALEALAARKTALVNEMNALAAARAAQLAHAGFAASADGMDAWLQAQPEAMRAEWRELLTLAAAGQELNRVNGLLIHGHIGRNQAALQVLRGGAQPAMYGKDGQQALNARGRSFVAG